jgi:hypothetical protein
MLTPEEIAALRCCRLAGPRHELAIARAAIDRLCREAHAAITTTVPQSVRARRSDETWLGWAIHVAHERGFADEDAVRDVYTTNLLAGATERDSAHRALIATAVVSGLSLGRAT